jgi:hypothetical protein
MKHVTWIAVSCLVLVACGGEDPSDPDAESCPDVLPAYERQSPSTDVPSCVADPSTMVGKSLTEVRACAGAPCFEAVTYESEEVTTGWWLYCGGTTCSNDCTPSARVAFENGSVTYVRRRVQ